MARIVIVCGLPGTGKTTFAAALARAAHAVHLNTDRIRHAMGRQGQYSIALKAAIYDSLLLRTREALLARKNVVLDGTFYKRRFRKAFIHLANELHTPIHWIEVTASDAVVRERVIKSRPYTEADYDVYQKVRSEFDPLPQERLVLDSEMHSTEQMVQLATEYLQLPGPARR